MTLFEKLQKACDMKFHLPALGMVDTEIKYLEVPSALSGEEALTITYGAEKRELDQLINDLTGFDESYLADDWIADVLKTNASIVMYVGKEYQFELISGKNGFGFKFMFKKVKNG